MHLCTVDAFNRRVTLTFGVLYLLCHAVNAKDILIDDVTIVSAELAAPIVGASVLIHDERIAKIYSRAAKPKKMSADIIKGTGLYLTPGLIDTHVHLGEIPGMRDDQEEAHPDIAAAARQQIPKSYLHFGFTTLVDLNSSPQWMAPWSAYPIRPDTYFCGAAPVMDGYPMAFVPKPMRYRMPYFLVEPDAANLPAGVDAAAHTPEAVISRMKADGAICVKTHFERGFGTNRNLPVPKVETIRALVRAAHAAQMPVFLHANSSEAQRFGLDAGVDIFAHGMWKWSDSGAATELTPPLKDILDDIVAQKRGWQATIQVLYGERDLFNDSFLSDPMLARAVPASLIAWYKTPEGQWFHDVLAKTARIDPSVKKPDVDAMAIARVNSSVAYLASHNARLLFGTDTPSDTTYANPPGLNGWLEMQRLIAAGVTPAQLFRAATLANAEAMGLDKEVGTVQEGKRANLLLLHEDPTKSIHAYDNIDRIILRGRAIDPAALAANYVAVSR
jgi:imidazolonepropionase-like amidohydrolase